MQRAATLANGFNQAAEAMAAQWGTDREQLGAIVDDVNATAKNIAALNDSIKTATVAGNSPNELAGRRDALVLHLADLIGATARPGESGTVDVSLGGSPLVTGAQSETLAVSGATDFADVPATPVTVTWAADGSQAAVGDGQAAGLLDALDAVLPRYRSGLDDVARAVASTVNAAQAAGYDLAGAQGTDFFGGTTVASLRVIVTDEAKVAASATPPDPVTGPTVEGGNAHALAEAAGKGSGPDEMYRQLIVGLGVDAQTANRRADIQKSITQEADSARAAVSGVNLDEEMANLVAFQHAYEGAAKYMSVVDTVLDTLINIVR